MIQERGRLEVLSDASLMRKSLPNLNLDSIRGVINEIGADSERERDLCDKVFQRAIEHLQMRQSGQQGGQQSVQQQGQGYLPQQNHQQQGQGYLPQPRYPYSPQHPPYDRRFDS